MERTTRSQEAPRVPQLLPLTEQPLPQVESTEVVLNKINALTTEEAKTYWACAGGSAFGRSCGCDLQQKSIGYEQPYGCGHTMFCTHKERFSYPVEVDENGQPITTNGMFHVEPHPNSYDPKSDQIQRFQSAAQIRRYYGPLSPKST